MSTHYIRKFLETQYSNSDLLLLATEIELGRFGWISCCCLVGLPTRGHDFQAAVPSGEIRPYCAGGEHLDEGRRLPYATEAESEYEFLASTDAKRNAILKPLVDAEIERRAMRELGTVVRQAREELLEETLEGGRL